jgi:hypothetical protein
MVLCRVSEIYMKVGRLEVMFHEARRRICRTKSYFNGSSRMSVAHAGINRTHCALAVQPTYRANNAAQSWAPPQQVSTCMIIHFQMAVLAGLHLLRGYLFQIPSAAVLMTMSAMEERRAHSTHHSSCLKTDDVPQR